MHYISIPNEYMIKAVQMREACKALAPPLELSAVATSFEKKYFFLSGRAT